MNKLENLLAKVFCSVCSEIDGNTERISENVTTKEIIEICEENNLTDLKKSYDFVLGIDDFPLTPYYREASDSAIERLFKQNIRVIKADYNDVVSQLKPSSIHLKEYLNIL